ELTFQSVQARARCVRVGRSLAEGVLDLQTQLDTGVGSGDVDRGAGSVPACVRDRFLWTLVTCSPPKSCSRLGSGSPCTVMRAPAARARASSASTDAAPIGSTGAPDLRSETESPRRSTTWARSLRACRSEVRALSGSAGSI